MPRIFDRGFIKDACKACIKAASAPPILYLQNCPGTDVFLSKKGTHRAGFTLMEMLLVIAILAALFSIVLVAINPHERLLRARDAERLSEVYTILHALHQYASDHEGTFPETLSAAASEVCRTGAGSCEGLLDLAALTDEERYLVTIPLDPFCAREDETCGPNETGYLVGLSEYGRAIVSARLAENDEIRATR